MTTAQLRELAEHVAFTEHWWILDWAAIRIEELEAEVERLKKEKENRC